MKADRDSVASSVGKSMAPANGRGLLAGAPAAPAAAGETSTLISAMPSSTATDARNTIDLLRFIGSCLNDFAKHLVAAPQASCWRGRCCRADHRHPTHHRASGTLRRVT